MKSFEDLTFKTITLLGLTSPNRGTELLTMMLCEATQSNGQRNHSKIGGGGGGGKVEKSGIIVDLFKAYSKRTA